MPARIRISFSGLCSGQFRRTRILQGSSRSYSSAFSPLELRFRPSFRLPIAVASAHLVALASISYAGLPPFSRSICAMLVLFSAVLSARSFIRPDPSEHVIGLSWFPDHKQLLLELANGERLPVDEIRQKLVMPGATVLSLIPRGRFLPVWLILTSDQVSAEEWRRLAIAIRWAPPPQRDASGHG
ncbi:protein YgfX [Marinobacterium zhoushanense]|uniref:protein YgfX n=1 Tax=Marinobacterium zhoushanense TaxID=1679163 RepID=UPI0035714789